MFKPKPIIPIHIEITDIITPKSCSIFVAELIKFIAFNKQQIPYPYERLKMFVLKRREHQKREELSNTQKETSTAHRIAYLMEKHYKKVEEAYKILDTTFKCIENELTSAEHAVEEIVLLFGATPVSPKDVFRIKIPALCFGHSESQHVWRKQIGNLFRGIIISDEINANFQKKFGPTNMFVMIKKKQAGGCVSSQWLLPKDHYRISDRAQQVCFSFRSSSSKPCSCLEISELEKLTENMTALSISDDVPVSDEVCNSIWYQTSKTLKGFRDCKSKGKSISDLWYKHKFL